MSSSPTQPESIQPGWSRRRKGCLIVLLIPPLALGILYADLLLTPTGYTDTTETSRATHEKILAPRLAPRQKTTVAQNPASSIPPPSNSPTPSPTTQNLDAPITSEEALFWSKASAKLWRWTEIFPLRELGTTELRPLSPNDLVSDPVTNTPGISPRSSEYMERKIQSDNVQTVRNHLQSIARLTALRGEDTDDPVSDSDEPVVTSEMGTQRIEQMNRIERFLLEGRWERPGFFYHVYPGSSETQEDLTTAYSILFSDISDGNLLYLVIHRAIRNQDTEKTSKIIEQYIRLSGEFLFADLEYLGVSHLDKIRLLGNFLSWIATDRQIPEETLEWTANTLASWKLEPQEYADLCAANRDQCRESLVASFKEIIVSQSEQLRGSMFWHYFLKGHLEETVTQAAAPILWRALDRKAAALKNQNEAEYREAHRIQKMALRTMNIPEGKLHSSRFNSWFTSSVSSYGDLMMEDGLAYDLAGRSIKNQEGLFSGQENFTEPGSPREKGDTAFAALKLLESAHGERFNRTIEMARMVFATARYRREHGRFPDSVEAMIPRYLDESFAPTEDQFWSIVKTKPLDTVVLPRFSNPPSAFSKILNAYVEDPRNEGRLPASLEELKPYANPKADLTPFAPYFVRIEEYPVLSLVVLKDEVQASLYEGIRKQRSGGATFQYLFFSFPPWNPEGCARNIGKAD